MGSESDIYIGRLRISRLWQHVGFWLAAYLVMVGIYGYNRSYSFAFKSNIFYAPLHLIYFYTLAYWLIPAFLLKNRVLLFATLLLILFVGIIYLDRIVDVGIIEPYVIKTFGRGSIWYPKEGMTFWEQVFNPGSFLSALKGINLIVWIALAIKLLKMWLERKNAALQAELNFLKGQIHPHFLFNTLNNLYALTLEQSPKSSEVVLKLSDMMRYMLYECNVDEIALSKDLKVLQEYMELEKIRYDSRLDFAFSVDGEITDKYIAPLLLLPLVENAFKHGVGDKPGECWVSVVLTISGNYLKLKVSNSKHDGDRSSQPGIGLKNLTKRLELLYGDAGLLKLFNEEDVFLAILEIHLDRRLQA